MKKELLILFFVFYLINNGIEAQNMSAGYSHSIVLCSDSTLWMSGSNNLLQRGTKTAITSNVFEAISSSGYALSAVGNSVIMLDLDNNIWSWGYNNFGQTGTGSIGDTAELAKVDTLNNIIYINTGENNAFAIKNDGSLWAWGYNLWGQLGDGTKVNRTNPVKIIDSGVKQVVASKTHTLALLNDGKLYSWGMNLFGELGQPLSTNKNLRPTEIVGLQNMIKVAAGMHYSVALKADGTVWTWGFNELGTLGNGNNNSTFIPAQILGLDSVVDIVSGQSHVLALTQKGEVYAWGLNLYGQIGDGSWSEQASPVKLNINNVIIIAAGAYHSLAATENGELFAWGNNNEGQLGLGNNSNQGTPKQINLPCIIDKIDPVCPTQAIASGNRAVACVSDSIEFSSENSNSTFFKWIVDDNELVQNNITYKFDSIGMYDVLLVANPNGCSDTATFQVEVLPIPEAKILSDSTLCYSNVPVNLAATDTLGIWSGLGVIDTILGVFDPAIVGSGLTEIFYTKNNGACAASDTLMINVVEQPKANFSYSFLNDSTVSFTNNATAFDSIVWSFGDGNSSQTTNATNVYDTSGIYIIQQKAISGCGVDYSTDTIVVSFGINAIIENELDQNFQLYPNPTKGIFYLNNLSSRKLISIEVFNAIGQKVYSINNIVGTTEIDLSDKRSGLYFIVIKVGENTITKEIQLIK